MDELMEAIRAYQNAYDAQESFYEHHSPPGDDASQNEIEEFQNAIGVANEEFTQAQEWLLEICANFDIQGGDDG